ENKQRHGTAGGPGENVNAPHGGEPMVIQAHEPIAGAEGKGEGKERQTNKGDLAHPNREPRIPVLILSNGKATQQLGSDDEEAEENNRAHEEEGPIEISAFQIQCRIASRRNVHPFEEMISKEQDGN